MGWFGSTGWAWTPDATVLLLITAAGAFGGMLYAVRDGGIETPHRDHSKTHRWNLGWISDCAYGVAGAYVVFLLLPTEIGNQQADGSTLLQGSIFDLLKVVALALVGGYGGRSIVDRALANLAKRIDHAEKTAEEAATEKEIDAEARELVQLQLDDEEEPQDEATLEAAVNNASRATRFEVFKEARSFRTKNWEKPESMLRVIPIFRALIDNAAGQVFHRNHAQLGYALRTHRGTTGRPPTTSSAGPSRCATGREPNSCAATDRRHSSCTSSIEPSARSNWAWTTRPSSPT